MEYKLKINQEAINLEVETDGQQQFSTTIGGRRHRVHYHKISEHVLHLTVDGRQTMAFVAETPEGKVVMVDGQAWLVEDAAAQTVRRKSGPGNGPKAVVPPMPAVVTLLLVAEGDAVKKGQGVVVVSAMKMDTTLAAPFDGVVMRINVAVGDKVMPTQVLVDIQAAAPEAASTAIT